MCYDLRVRSSIVLDVDLSTEAKEPLFLRIARALEAEIRRGRLRAGDPVPGSRALASSLGVHRNTVLAALRELLAEGWIVTEPARGTFVSPRIPEVSPRRFSSRAPRAAGIAARTGYDVPPSRTAYEASLALPLAERPGRVAMTLGGGVPDVRLAPGEELARAMRRVLRQRPHEVLSYGPPEGPLRLRRALAGMFSSARGLAATEDDVLVTRGSQMGIDLAARCLLRERDVVLVESLGYRPAWAALEAAGARLVPVPVDEGGLDVEAAARLAEAHGARGVYVTPHHQFPTTVTLSAARRLALLELARARRMFVLEDDYDHEFHYEGRPVLPLASADVHGVVVYVGTLSKVLAPGLRIGFVVAPRPLLAKMTLARKNVDRQGDGVVELAVAELIEDGVVARHVRRARRVYEERRGELAALLARHLGDDLAFRLPSGGTALWARVARGLDVDAWAARAAEEGLVVQTGRMLSFDGRARPHLRLGFAQHDPREAEEAVKRLARARPRGLARVSGRSRGGSTRALPDARSSP